MGRPGPLPSNQFDDHARPDRLAIPDAERRAGSRIDGSWLRPELKYEIDLRAGLGYVFDDRSKRDRLLTFDTLKHIDRASTPRRGKDRSLLSGR